MNRRESTAIAVLVLGILCLSIALVLDSIGNEEGSMLLLGMALESALVAVVVLAMDRRDR